MEERWNSQDLIEVCKMYKGFTKMGLSELFLKDLNVKGIRCHRLKLKKSGCIMDSRKFFSHRAVGCRMLG